MICIDLAHKNEHPAVEVQRWDAKVTERGPVENFADDRYQNQRRVACLREYGYIVQYCTESKTCGEGVTVRSCGSSRRESCDAYHSEKESDAITCLHTVVV